MKGYVISDIEVTDPEAFEHYKALSARSVAQHGGTFIVRGGAFAVVEGDWQPKRISVIEFPSVHAAETWIASEDYAPARAVRQGSASSRILIAEGAS